MGRMNKTRRDLALSLGSQIAFKLIGFATIALLARHLSQEDFGRLTFALAVCAAGILFTDLGLCADLVRKISAQPETARERVERTLSARIPLLVAFLVLVNALMAATKPELLPITLGIAAFAAFKDAYRSYASAFIARRRIDRSIVCFGLGSLLTLAGVFAAKLWEFGMAWVVVSYSLGGFAMLALAARAFRRLFGRIRARASWRLTRTYAFSALGLFALTGLASLHFSVDTVALGYLGDYRQVAAFEAAARLYEAAQFAVRPLALIMFPVCAKLASARLWPELVPLLSKMYLGAAVLGVAAWGGVALLAAPVVAFVYSEQFLDSASILRILYLSAPGLFLASVGIFVSASLHREVHACIAMSVGLAAKIGVNLWAIPAYGPTGAAAVNLGTQTLIAAYLVSDSYRFVVSKRHAAESGDLPHEPAST